jgi:hypothetical protein
MVRRYFRLRRLILGSLALAAIAAIAVPVAQARHWDSGSWTKHPVVAQASQYRAQPDAYGNEWRARLDSYQGQSGQTASDKAEKVSTSASGGFDWTDAGIGAAVVFGAVAILLAVALGRGHRSHPAGLAKA